MTVLSKLATVPIETQSKVVTWNQYFDDKIDLNKSKIDELKRIAKQNGLFVSGNKKILIDRITGFFSKVKMAVRMQSIYRGTFARKILQMRGAGLKDRKQCVNDTDFFTLDSIHDIYVTDFFSYTDEAGFIYGFDLHSLRLMLKNRGVLTNPYNREILPEYIVRNIKLLLKLQPLTEEYVTETTPIMPHRKKSTPIRLRELFCYIDSLGNYTESRWFSELNRMQCIRFLQNMYEIWYHRSNMTNSTRAKICPYFDPFYDGLLYLTRDVSELNETEIHIECITVMENMVYTGIDDEYKNLGALHMLSALTLVSIPARNSMPWLYESLVF